MAARSNRRSKVRRLAPPVRKVIERMLREDTLTLDEMIAQLQAQFPNEKLPSRSGLHRYQAGLEEMLGRMREIDTAARVVVQEMGHQDEDRSGMLLGQAIVTIASNAAIRAQNDEKISIEDIRKLARAANDAMSTKSRARVDRKASREEYRAELLREQADRLDAAVKASGMTSAVADSIRRDILGIRE